MGGSKGTVSVRLATLADQSPASVKPLLEAVRGSMAGATKGSGTRKEFLDGADLSYLAERAQAVVTNPAIPHITDLWLAVRSPRETSLRSARRSRR